MNRRQFLKRLGAGLASAFLPWPSLLSPSRVMAKHLAPVVSAGVMTKVYWVPTIAGASSPVADELNLLPDWVWIDGNP